jgi:hypothetical protein
MNVYKMTDLTEIYDIKNNIISEKCLFIEHYYKINGDFIKYGFKNILNIELGYYYNDNKKGFFILSST